MQAPRTWQSNSRRFRNGVILVCLAQCLDIVTTIVGFRLGIAEDNPIMSFVLHRQGELAMFGLKIAIVGAIIVLIGRLRWPANRVWPLLLLMTLLATVIVIRNVALIAQVVA